MTVVSDNLNLNLNLNLGASAGAGGATGYGRARFNTEDMCKLAPPQPATWPLPTKKYSDDWDPTLRAWSYVYEFMTVCNWGGGTPVSVIRDAINAQQGINSFPVPYGGAKTPLTPSEMANQVYGVINASLDRADRAMEILDQATAPGALNYWTGLVRIDPSHEKNTFLLMMAALKISEYVAMGLKDIYKMRRPSQVHPLILPLIDPPDTPSYPSSHSLQAHLISGVLTLALTDPAGQTATALAYLADRVARNREIAGVHYPMDSAAGAFAAGKCLAQLNALPGSSAFQMLVKQAQGELSDLP